MNKEDAIPKGTYEEIVITGIPRKLYIEERPLDSIRLDPENPRFRDILLLEGKSYTDKELEEQIWQEDDTKDLFNAIKASKGLQEQPLITKDGIVKEGNRRIVCLRKLRKLVNDKQVPSIPFGTFDRVKVKVLPDDITETEVDVLMARYHVAGKKEWAALNQAAHIYELTEKDGLTIADVAVLLGKSKPYIYQKLWAFKETREFLKKHKGREIKDFSFFEEYYKKRSSIEDEAKIPKEKIHSWIVEGKFNDEGARDMRELPKIWSDQKLRDIFIQKGMKEAKAEMVRGDPTLGSRTFSDINDAILALRAMPMEEYNSIARNPAETRLILELYSELRRIISDLKLTKEAEK